MLHSELVKALVKPPEIIISQLSNSDANLIHMVIGVSSEAGELLDAIKKKVIYQKPLDLLNVVEELGDIEFYLEGIRQELNISREATLTANINKLSKRYAKLTYTDADAIARADKQ